MPAWLWALASAAFVFFTDDYVIAGVLPEIAAEFAVTEAVAGQLITVFSLTVAIAAPVAAVVTASWPRRRLLLTASAVFVAANVAAALTPSFGLLMALRVLAALAAAAATPTLFAVTAALAPEERRGRYLGVVSIGVTGSIAAGVPIGTWIGGEFGWRATFATIAVAGALAGLAILASVPATPSGPVPRLGEQFAVLARRPITLGLLANAVTLAGSMLLLSYLAPFVRELSGTGPDGRALLFAVSGVAGMLGVWLGGLAVDRVGADRALLIGIGGLVAVLAVFAGLWFVRPVPFWLVVPLSVVWAGFAFWNSPAIQARLLTLAGPVGGQALALNTTATYLGVSLAGALGGMVLAGVGPGGLAPVAAVLVAASWVVFRLAVVDARTSRSPTGHR
ncbi:MFS transporter [Pseudonocardia sp. MH-G8]|uniref:MFS transporter n=1 Tax=Pseudonocardia sp. MH-G8 TaxID=1854588 RepID=UPI000BA039E0|nr:MFS transporter [Pseudonocardia sp. MH-G8]OZM77675.1 MFS transporter [Pseudonocardia sp. MH-G8]